ncbi:MAG: tRNA-dihydrouridine synthase family protein [Bacteroidales bacterium]|nr:tRNA-dihydrouridine synthase family protein [Bacteroidales bacterium]
MMTLSLAPFQGITDSVYRNLYKEYFTGIDKFYTPFFTGIHKDNSRSLKGEEIDIKLNDVNTLTPQILGNDADEIIRFANQCQAMGYREINLNMGCPFPRVANKTRGCGLMAEPLRVREIFDKVFNNIDIKFSLKCRLGYFKDTEIDKLIESFNIYPFSEIIIHPRIGKQLYTGSADVDRFAEVASQINSPLVYNGDIFSVEDFKRISAKVPSVSMFMLGRGLLSNPFLADEIKGKTFDYEERKKRLHHFMVSLYLERLRHAGGSPKIIGCMKELWSYVMNSFEDPQDIWRKIKKINNLDVYEETVEIIFRDKSLLPIKN